MTLTQTDLIQEAYAEVTLSRDEPASDDVAIITKRLSSSMADLRTRTGLVIDLADIPDEAFPHLIAILAEEIAPKFGGRPKNEAVRMMAETKLKAQSRENTSERIRALYY
jgi:hypothetical protein